MHSMVIVWLFIGIIFIQNVVWIDAEGMALSQHQKMVADLKVSHDFYHRRYLRYNWKIIISRKKQYKGTQCRKYIIERGNL